MKENTIMQYFLSLIIGVIFILSICVILVVLTKKPNNKTHTEIRIIKVGEIEISRDTINVITTIK